MKKEWRRGLYLEVGNWLICVEERVEYLSLIYRTKVNLNPKTSSVSLCRLRIRSMVKIGSKCYGLTLTPFYPNKCKSLKFLVKLGEKVTCNFSSNNLLTRWRLKGQANKAMNLCGKNFMGQLITLLFNIYPLF